MRMALLSLERLIANIVVVPDLATEQALSFSAEEIGAILKGAQIQVVDQPANQIQVTSVRDQVVVLLAGGRLLFEDQSDGLTPRSKLAEVVDSFVRLVGPKGIERFRAYGFNFDVTFDASGDSPAAKTIMQRYVKADLLADMQIRELGGAGLRLYFKEGEATCDLRIEPAESKVEAVRYFAHINYHYKLDDGMFPQLEQVRSDFPGKWALFTQLLERLLIQ